MIRNKKLKVKRLLSLILITVLIFHPIKVYASMISINEVASEYAKTRQAQEWSKLFSLSAETDETNKKFNIYSNDEVALTMNYTDEYIEYINNDEITEANATQNSFTPIYVLPLIEAILNVSGYNDKLIEIIEYDNYEEYGIIMQLESFDFSGSNENGSWSIKGECLRHLKISLDSEKIAKLVSVYGIDRDSLYEEDSDEFIDEAPVVYLKEITSNSINVRASIESLQDSDLDDENIPVCYFYRSINPNDGFEKISDFAANCVDGISIVDEGLESNTTYYYKAIVKGGTKWSEVVSATTLKESVENNPTVDKSKKEEVVKDKNGKVVENPDTGNIVPLIALFSISIAGLLLFIKSKKGNKLNKI